MEEKFVCECGREFDTLKSLNLHRGHCVAVIGTERKAMQLEKCNKPATEASIEATHKRSQEFHAKKQQEELDWLASRPLCENCGEVITIKYGSGRFCSQQCARSTAAKANVGKVKSVICCECGNTFMTPNNSGKIMCDICAKSHKNKCKCCGKVLDGDNKTGYCQACLYKSDEFFEKRQEAGKKAAESRKQNGTQVPWQSRKIKSYAEIFWRQVLDNNEIQYTAELPVKKSDNKACYFLDFYIEVGSTKLDLEIDGKQHKYAEKAKHDLERDAYLTSIGYTVYRIDWNKIDTEDGKQKMKDKIDAFLEYIKSLS